MFRVAYFQMETSKKCKLMNDVRISIVYCYETHTCNCIPSVHDLS
jgi:hypothetical protein